MRLWQNFSLGIVLLAAACALGTKLHPLTIVTKNGERHFQVELAITPEETTRGLMFRTELAPDRGMLFKFDKTEMLSFWMKNTLIPLDIIFIRQDGTIARIHRMARPKDETPLSSGEPVNTVLEIPGGEADKQGIVEGDLIKTELQTGEKP